jgi:hypothetical protein
MMDIATEDRARPAAEEVRGLRSTLAWLRSEGDLIETDREVDPDLENARKRMQGWVHFLARTGR